jgi:hypothetical protein
MGHVSTRFHRMLHVARPQVELDRARILVRIGQLILTRMPAPLAAVLEHP